MKQEIAQKTGVNPAKILLPDAPIMVLDGHRIFCLTTDGEFTHLEVNEAKMLVQQHMPIVCNALRMASKLGVDSLASYDVLELFAFACPGVFVSPSLKGISRALNLFEPTSLEDKCMAARDIAKHLLLEMAGKNEAERDNLAAIAHMMGLESDDNKGWAWTETVLHALGRYDDKPSRKEVRAALRVWTKLQDWSAHAPEPLPSHHGVDTDEALARLDELLHHQDKEDRVEQHDYVEFISKAFKPMEEEGKPNILLAEAGTGVGKTLGYLSPATVWAEKNEGTVWVSTYTRNLQRQIDAELKSFYKDPVARAMKVVTRKGRENYLCLLNLEDIAKSPTIANNAKNAIALGLMLRWVSVTEDGDLMGKDFPGWLLGVLGWQRINSFADKRGECVYSACPHFDKCFVEKSIRKAKRADIVIANHALVMNQITSSVEDGTMPSHYIFDEGHHIFEAADSALDLDLNGKEAADLRRWLLGLEGGKRGRARGIKRRIEDLVGENEEALKALDDIMNTARTLPDYTWKKRLTDGEPKGVMERFLHLCYQQVQARNKESARFYSIETEVSPPIEGLLEASYALKLRFDDMRKPMRKIIKVLQDKMVDEADALDTETRERITFVINSLNFRSQNQIAGWIAMLDRIQNPDNETSVDWLEITRAEGRDSDVGIYCRYIDPAAVFVKTIKPQLQGMVVTSASLRGTSNADEDGWDYALKRSGVTEECEPKLFNASSPFDYKKQTKIFIVTDVNKGAGDEVASAYRELFFASGGGALGIFTSIQRLKAIHKKIIGKLERNNMHLYSQHIDPLDIASLIDLFREEENACLLGTDATRDGIDVPGKSLRLVVYDRVPWPKPNILHKARRKYFGRGYDDMLTRFKLKQAYGRLIRRCDDKGVFVMLDNALPTRMLNAFPEGVEVERIGLKDVIAKTREFLG